MTETSYPLVIREADPAAVIATVNNVAGACKAIVAASAMSIQGRAYIKVEGWQAIAAAHGCTASADLVEQVDGGIRSVATIRRLTDGAVLGQAEGFVGEDELMWAKRPLYARRAMAQTRAISRACRSAFAHVVVAMNAGHGTKYSTTPAEEVPPDGFDDRRQDREPEPKESPKEQAPARPVWTKEQTTEYRKLQAEIEANGGKQMIVDMLTKNKNSPAADVLDLMQGILETINTGNR